MTRHLYSSILQQNLFYCHIKKNLTGSFFSRVRNTPSKKKCIRFLSIFSPHSQILNDNFTSQTHCSKVVLESYNSQGFDVSNITDNNESIFLNGSIIAFPTNCFMYKPKSSAEITVSSLSLIILHKPVVDLLLIGCDVRLNWRDLSSIRKSMKKYGIIVEDRSLMDAIGTFNLLNIEDRNVAAILIP